jgi:hypothetical protein
VNRTSHSHTDLDNARASTPVDGDASLHSTSVPVGDVLISRDDLGYGIFNYRGERVLDLPLRSSAEAARLAEEIVAPWHGHVCMDPGLAE